MHILYICFSNRSHRFSEKPPRPHRSPLAVLSGHGATAFLPLMHNTWRNEFATRIKCRLRRFVRLLRTEYIGRNTLYMLCSNDGDRTRVYHASARDSFPSRPSPPTLVPSLLASLTASRSWVCSAFFLSTCQPLWSHLSSRPAWGGYSSPVQIRSKVLLLGRS